MAKEEVIGKKQVIFITQRINELFKTKEQKLNTSIFNIIAFDKSAEKIYLEKKTIIDSADRLRILKEDLDDQRKKPKKRRQKNMEETVKKIRERFYLILKIINAVVVHYRELYQEDDYYRHKKIIEATSEVPKANISDIIRKAQEMSKERQDAITTQSNVERQSTVMKTSLKNSEIEQKQIQKLKEEINQKVATVTAQPEVPIKLNDKQKQNRMNQLRNFFYSPFKDDRHFSIKYLAQFTRDKLEDCDEIVEELFFDSIFNTLVQNKRENKDAEIEEKYKGVIKDQKDPSKADRYKKLCQQEKEMQKELGECDERNKQKAFQILCNLVNHKKFRSKLKEEGYFSKVFSHFRYIVEGKNVDDKESKLLEKLSWLATLLCFYQDMIEEIDRLKLLDFILEISKETYKPQIRSNAVLALSLLTYHEAMFENLLKKGVIELVMRLCKDNKKEDLKKEDSLKVKQFSTLALVHFALNKKSVQMLIDQDVMSLFYSFTSQDAESTHTNEIIQTNVSWIFLALCNNKITGEQMLKHGITRDMFMVSCNQKFNQIRHLVIAGFAELGRCTSMLKVEEKKYSEDVQKVKETAIVGMHKNFKQVPQQTIDILLKFTVSGISYWALKDYILLNHETLISDLRGVIKTFVNGCISEDREINTECANAISFLITHRIVYKQNGDEENTNILDALMFLTSSKSEFVIFSNFQIRTRAFSTLSTLSTYASTSAFVMQKIKKDIRMDHGKASNQYFDHINNKLKQNQKQVQKEFQQENVEEKQSGLFCLLQIANNPTEEVIEEASQKLKQFIDDKKNNQGLSKQTTISPRKSTKKLSEEELNEIYFLHVFQSLKFSKEKNVLMRVISFIRFYIMHQSTIQQEIINPDTIIWLLDILEEHKSEKKLCLASAKTLLAFVSQHQIVFDYQEVAIIKKFNVDLQNLDVFDSQLDDSAINKSDYSGQSRRSHRRNASKRRVSSRHRSSKSGFGISKPGEGSKIELPNVLDDPVEKTVVKELQTEEQKGTQSYLVDEDTGKNVLFDNLKNVINEGNSEQNFPVFSDMKPDTESNKIFSEQTQKGEKDKKTLGEEVKAGGFSEQLDADMQNIVIEGLESSQNKLLENPMTPKSEVESFGLSDRKSKSFYNNREARAPSIALQPLESSPIGLGQKKSIVLESPVRRKDSVVSTSSRRQNFSVPKQDQELLKNDQQILKKLLDVSEPTQTGKEKSDLSELLQVSEDGRKKSKALKKQDRRLQQELGKTPEMKNPLLANIQKKTMKFLAEHFKQKECKKADREHKEFDSLVSSIDSQDEDMMDHHLRDALIKSFMVIFTHEQSQHLLLNKDLIDIAFNCLEFCEEISVEAKQKLAKLISIIFKFPQVQDKLLIPEVINGVNHLLEQETEHEIVKNTVRSCTYLSMNFEFISTQLSVEILKNLMNLFDVFEGQERQNLFFSISNILKGLKQSKEYFISQGGADLFLSIILEEEVDERVIQLCFSSIKELTTSTSSLERLMSENGEKLQQVIVKCFDMTDRWEMDRSRAKQQQKQLEEEMPLKDGMLILDDSSRQFTQIENESPLYPNGEQQISDYQESVTSDEKAQQLQIKKLKDNQEFQSKVEDSILIRNQVYYVVARCIKYQIEPDFLLKDARLVFRIMTDLVGSQDEFSFFENILMALNALEEIPQNLNALLSENSSQLIQFIDLFPENSENKISYLKVLMSLVLASLNAETYQEEPTNLGSNSPFYLQKFLQEFLSLLTSSEQKDSEVTENLIWLVSAMIEQNHLDSVLDLLQNSTLVKYIHDLILKSDIQERILLQGLKTLSICIEHPQLYDQFAARLQEKKSYRRLILIGSQKHLQKHEKYQKEIRCAISRLQLNILRFSDFSVKREFCDADGLQHIASCILQTEYEYKQDGMDLEMDEQELEALLQNQPGQDGVINCDIIGLQSEDVREINLKDLGQPVDQLLLEEQVKDITLDSQLLDDIQRVENENESIEDCICCFQYLALDKTLHAQIIYHGFTQIVEKVVKVIEGENKDMRILEDISEMSIGLINMLQSIAKTIYNLCLVAQNLEPLIEKQIFSLSKSLLKVKDYELQTDLYMALGNFIVPFQVDLQEFGQQRFQAIQKQAVSNGIVESIRVASEQSEFIKIKRVCQQILAHVDSSVMIDQ